MWIGPVHKAPFYYIARKTTIKNFSELQFLLDFVLSFRYRADFATLTRQQEICYEIFKFWDIALGNLSHLGGLDNLDWRNFHSASCLRYSGVSIRDFAFNWQVEPSTIKSWRQRHDFIFSQTIHQRLLQVVQVFR
jgi:hypothetical protein